MELSKTGAASTYYTMQNVGGTPQNSPLKGAGSVIPSGSPEGTPSPTGNAAQPAFQVSFSPEAQTLSAESTQPPMPPQEPPPPPPPPQGQGATNTIDVVA